MWSKLVAIKELQFFTGNLMWSKLAKSSGCSFRTGRLMLSKLVVIIELQFLFYWKFDDVETLLFTG